MVKVQSKETGSLRRDYANILSCQFAWLLLVYKYTLRDHLHLELVKMTICKLFLFNTGLYGTLFRRNKEAAFSNYRLWESAGFVIAYAYSTHLCARMKLYVMFVVLCIGVVGYCVVEILHKRKKLRMKKAEEEAKKQAAQNQIRGPPPVEETDDEKDDIDEEVVVTHL